VNALDVKVVTLIAIALLAQRVKIGVVGEIIVSVLIVRAVIVAAVVISAALVKRFT
jgi:hypothetical protein